MTERPPIPGLTTVFWQRGKPHGTCFITLRGELLCCTFLAVHGVKTRFYDVRCATHEFRRHLNSRWFLKGTAVALTLFVLGSLLGGLLPENPGAVLAPILILPGMLIAMAALLSLLFLRKTVRVRFYSQEKLHWIEFPYSAGEDPVLDALIARTAVHDRFGNPPLLRLTIWLDRDWLPAFPIRYILLNTFIAYEVAPFVLFVPVLLLAFIYQYFDLDRFDLENYVLTPIVASPAVCVILWVLVSLRRNEGPWSHIALRRQVLKMSHKGQLQRTMQLLEAMVEADPGDCESVMMRAQILIALGEFDEARDCISRTGHLGEREASQWATQIDYAEYLDGQIGARNRMADRRWREELEAVAED